MNSGKLSSNKELSVVSPIGTSKLRAITKDVSDRLRDLFYRKSSSKELIIIDTTLNNLVENRMNPLENMMNQVASKVKQLPDESIIILARGLDKVFGIGVDRDRKTKTKYINYVIMQFYSEGEELPTMFIDKTDTIIVKFGIVVKERLDTIRQHKLAELMGNISSGIDQLASEESILELARELQELLGKRRPGKEIKEEDYVNWDNEFKVEYINAKLLLKIGIKEQLPEILEKDANIIIEGFKSMLQEKAKSILDKKGAKLGLRITQSKK